MLETLLHTLMCVLHTLHKNLRSLCLQLLLRHQLYISLAELRPAQDGGKRTVNSSDQLSVTSKERCDVPLSLVIAQPATKDSMHFDRGT